ncbi:MAG TPA: hypothetical protein VGE21_15900 [Flavobacteriales bacterium]
MAMLIADIGGTSSRWVLLGAEGTDRTFDRLPGFNPATGVPEPLLQALRVSELIGHAATVDRIVVYGAGCGNATRQERMREALAALWPTTVIEVNSDLLGAARGLWGDHQGLVLILGTGMNAGYYDGATVRCPMPSLGYILGDEGSGADLGKHLLRDLFQGTLPQAVQEVVFPEAPELGEVIEKLHRGTAPQAWMASFAGALARLPEDPYTIDLVTERFTELAVLIERFFLEAERRDVQAIGSVAHGFQDLLGPVLALHGMRLISAVQDPMAGLVAHHRRAPK